MASAPIVVAATVVVRRITSACRGAGEQRAGSAESQFRRDPLAGLSIEVACATSDAIAVLDHLTGDLLCESLPMTRLGVPAIAGIHHFGLTVRDVDASADWYEEVLGFRRVGEFESPDGARRKVFLRHEGLRARLGLTQHRGGGQDAFDETRVGLDHLSFAVADRAALDRWMARLAAFAVTHSLAAQANSIPGAVVLVLRDPDNIQLELFFDPSEGPAKGVGTGVVAERAPR